ncbi:hypothetical protein [Niabella aurantiaca]|uniref:hypothetical protein n=1 Tax=Niabella aurantiaca TaxID=379900 RepID=UPI00037AC8F8|nr:hypothetical protein [Niabella aurantiaca]
MSNEHQEVDIQDESALKKVANIALYVMAAIGIVIFIALNGTIGFNIFGMIYGGLIILSGFVIKATLFVIANISTTLKEMKSLK